MIKPCKRLDIEPLRLLVLPEVVVAIVRFVIDDESISFCSFFVSFCFIVAFRKLVMSLVLFASIWMQ